MCLSVHGQEALNPLSPLCFLRFSSMQPISHLSPTPSILLVSLLSGSQYPGPFPQLPLLPGESFPGMLSVRGLEQKIYHNHQVAYV